jgi:hypothetical protein
LVDGRIVNRAAARRRTRDAVRSHLQETGYLPSMPDFNAAGAEPHAVDALMRQWQEQQDDLVDKIIKDHQDIFRAEWEGLRKPQKESVAMTHAKQVAEARQRAAQKALDEHQAARHAYFQQLEDNETYWIPYIERRGGLWVKQYRLFLEFHEHRRNMLYHRFQARTRDLEEDENPHVVASDEPRSQPIAPAVSQAAATAKPKKRRNRPGVNTRRRRALQGAGVPHEESGLRIEPIVETPPVSRLEICRVVGMFSAHRSKGVNFGGPHRAVRVSVSAARVALIEADVARSAAADVARRMPSSGVLLSARFEEHDRTRQAQPPVLRGVIEQTVDSEALVGGGRQSMRMLSARVPRAPWFSGRPQRVVSSDAGSVGPAQLGGDSVSSHDGEVSPHVAERVIAPVVSEACVETPAQLPEGLVVPESPSNEEVFPSVEIGVCETQDQRTRRTRRRVVRNVEPAGVASPDQDMSVLAARLAALHVPQDVVPEEAPPEEICLHGPGGEPGGPNVPGTPAWYHRICSWWTRQGKEPSDAATKQAADLDLIATSIAKKSEGAAARISTTDRANQVACRKFITPIKKIYPLVRKALKNVDWVRDRVEWDTYWDIGFWDHLRRVAFWVAVPLLCYCSASVLLPLIGAALARIFRQAPAGPAKRACDAVLRHVVNTNLDVPYRSEVAPGIYVPRVPMQTTTI